MSSRVSGGVCSVCVSVCMGHWVTQLVKETLNHSTIHPATLLHLHTPLHTMQYFLHILPLHFGGFTHHSEACCMYVVIKADGIITFLGRGNLCCSNLIIGLTTVRTLVQQYVIIVAFNVWAFCILCFLKKRALLYYSLPQF